MRHAPLIALGLAATLAACSKTEPPADPVRAVRTLTIAPQSAGGVVEYAGEIRARTESRLSFRVGGKMVKRLVDLGDVVKPGQLLAQLDAQDLRLGQDAARASAAAAQASYEQNLADYKRYKDLADKGFIGPAELDRREMAMKTARAQFDQARAQSAVQGNQARYASLAADAGGVITGIDLEPGMVASAGTPVLRLAHDGPRDVVFAVPEDKVGLVKALAAQGGGFSARIWGSAAGDAVLPATIREISAAADPATRTFLVKADIGDAAGTARLGQTATVQMQLPQTGGVTKLPLSALREDRGRSAVWLVDRATMTVRSQDVQLAGAEGNEAVISAGLAPGQVVVTAGVHVLSPGQKVKFYVDPGAPASGVAAAPAATPVGVK
ncbi:MAG TPA: efflux RND transporter periplasmic adaptor subunit [Burkholderiaceae bacterium]|nr:efflux RND transporter periplasmic adaptor subunit [Burkholderiaceae bacterium]